MYIHENIQISVTPFGRTGVNRQLHQTAVSFFIEIGKHLVNITPCTVVYSSLIMTLRCQVSRTPNNNAFTIVVALAEVRTTIFFTILFRSIDPTFCEEKSHNDREAKGDISCIS